MTLAGGLVGAEPIGISGALSSGAAVGPPEAPPSVGSLLVARRGLPDPNFDHTVVLLLAHGEEDGSVGVVINRRGERRVGEVTPQTSPLADREDVLYLGGPVDPSAMIVLLREEGEGPADSSEILRDVHLLSGRVALEQLAAEQVPSSRVRFYAGYAGWAPGQLEAEMARGDWHLVEGRASWIFTRHPETAWEELTRFLFTPRA